MKKILLIIGTCCGVTRMGIAVYNTKEEVEYVIDVLEKSNGK